ncbi:MAG: superoxide dismutase [Anaerotruncus sp.]|nr:superoxide dismutase [Anaerotruncus sp.]
MNEHYPFILAPLPYPCDALEPYIDSLTVTIHHERHQAGYVQALNELLCGCPQLQGYSLEALICNKNELPEKVRDKIQRNAGGLWAHELYFDCMTRCGSGNGAPCGKLAKAIEQTYGCFAQFQEVFTQTALQCNGSGWVWLACKQDGSLCILCTPLQETPLPQGMRAILVVDVWEHAYYLKYQNRRELYLQNWWKLVDWEFAERNYADIP